MDDGAKKCKRKAAKCRLVRLCYSHVISESALQAMGYKQQKITCLKGLNVHPYPSAFCSRGAAAQVGAVAPEANLGQANITEDTW